MRKRPNSSITTAPQAIMKLDNERRVVVTLNTSDDSLSIVYHARDVLQRLFQRRTPRSFELAAVRSLKLRGSELRIRIGSRNLVRLECGSTAVGETWCVDILWELVDT